MKADSQRKIWPFVGLLFVVSFFLAASRVNYGDTESVLPMGPGIATDEAINVVQGVYLNEQILKHGPGLWIPETTKEVFEDSSFLPDHPPFGRAALGFCEMLFYRLLPSGVDGQPNITAARIAPCLMFAATVSLIFLIVRSRYNTSTALLSAILLMIMPRMVAHARLGALETATTMTWLLALSIPLLRWTSVESEKPRMRWMAIAGACWGLLLLTKMQGVLMMPVIGLWAVRQFGFQFWKPCLVAGLVGMTVFFVGWPWLLLDPIEHAKEYFLRTGVREKDDRLALFVWYFGDRCSDRSVPFHFPFVMSAITVPAVVLAGFLARCVQRSFDRFEQLAALSIFVPLVIFALPGTPVYDGTRLFIFVMPMIAFLAARGIMFFVTHVKPRVRLISRVGLFVGLLLPLPALLSPFSLVSYGMQVGGTSGAAALGMETDYWGIGLNGNAWKGVPENSTIMVTPVSHQIQLRDLHLLHPEIRKRNLTLVSFRYTPEEKGLLLAIHRRGDLRPALAGLPTGAKKVGEVTYGKTPLATLLDLSDVEWETVPDWP